MNTPRRALTGPLHTGVSRRPAGRADVTHQRLNAIDGQLRRADRASTPSSRGSPPRPTDQDYCRLLRARACLCLRLGFSPPPAGLVPRVFLASPAELSGVYDLIAEFPRDFLAWESR